MAHRCTSSSQTLRSRRLVPTNGCPRNKHEHGPSVPRFVGGTLPPQKREGRAFRFGDRPTQLTRGSRVFLHRQASDVSGHVAWPHCRQRFNVSFAFSTTLTHLGSAEAAAYSSCQFHHLYGGVCG